MFKQATVEDVSNSRITKRHGHVAVVTRYYPRYLKKTLHDEYIGELAPTKALLEEFKAKEDETRDHDKAFDDVAYEEKFTLSQEGLEQLKRLAEIASTKTVYLVCHCKIGQRCHREVLMVIAEALYGAKIGKLHFSWKTIRDRLPDRITR